MSELEALCYALEDGVRGLPAVAGDLKQRAQRLRSIAAQIQQAARQVTNGPNVSRVVAGLQEAARAMDRSGQALTDAVQQSRGYVARTMRGGETTGIAGAMGRLAGDHADGGGFSEADRAALADYTGNGYEEINPMLRGQTPPDAEMMIRAAAVSKALAKLPNYEGTVVRGRNLTSQADVDFYGEGNVVRERGFTSTDIDTPFRGNAIFIIRSKRGKDVSAYSANGPNTSAQEHEVLFEAGTRFRVVKHTIIGGMHRIFMEEV